MTQPQTATRHSGADSTEPELQDLGGFSKSSQSDSPIMETYRATYEGSPSAR